MKLSLSLLALIGLISTSTAISEESKETSKQEEAEAPKVDTTAVAEKKMTLQVDLQATALPKDLPGVIFQPEVWRSFSVIDALAHGSPVTQGEPVIKVDTESLDQAIVDQQSLVDSKKLSLEQTQTSLERLQRDQELARERSSRSLKRLLEDHNYFLEVSIPLTKRNIEASVDVNQRRLESAQEELRQLTAMYEEDELTEETEEIILKRSRNQVKDAKFNLEKAELSAKKTLEVELPREIDDEKRKIEQAKRSAADEEQDRQFTLQRKQEELKSAQLAHQRSVEKLEALQSDRETANFAANCDGLVFYGIIDAGKEWNLSEAPKRLVRGGSLAPGQPLFTIVPDGCPLLLTANVDSLTKRKLELATTGFVTLAGSKSLTAPVRVTSISEHRQLSGTYKVVLEASDADFLTAGETFEVKLHGETEQACLVIPKAAAKVQADGTLVVKRQADDGTFAEQAIKTGLETNDALQVTQGLKLGDLIESELK